MTRANMVERLRRMRGLVMVELDIPDESGGYTKEKIELEAVDFSDLTIIEEKITESFKGISAQKLQEMQKSGQLPNVNLTEFMPVIQEISVKCLGKTFPELRDDEKLLNIIFMRNAHPLTMCVFGQIQSMQEVNDKLTGKADQDEIQEIERQKVAREEAKKHARYTRHARHARHTGESKETGTKLSGAADESNGSVSEDSTKTLTLG